MANATNIIEYMKTHKGITVQECSQKLGTTELRKEVSKLRRKGYGIESVWENGVNKFGAKTKYCRYFLIHEPEMVKENKKTNFLDKAGKALYTHNYMEMLENLRIIRLGEGKKDDKCPKCKILL